MAGKGDKRRPSQVSYDEWSKNWEKAFRKRGESGVKTDLKPS